MQQLLLIIDAQQELIDGTIAEQAIYKKEDLIISINKVIHKAERENIEIVFVKDLDVAGGEGDGFQIHNEITQLDKARIFNKSATNAFYNTGLLEYVTHHHIGHVVIMGCETQHCIDSAVRTATIHSMDVTLIADGHSTRGNDVLEPEQIIHHHNSTLHGRYNVDHFSIVRNSNEEVFSPTHDQYR
ncbi:isochorismatase family protein [Shouchella patagoniensis]|uniref:isochorismatase family protein n=1 Tax=Shouchella patagoniensis TaxID=228576 RepID=UPI0009958C1C|nr:isochorismatase family protein [Shouchella patagoniensis]